MNLLPQFGFFELVLVAVVALIVVGPKDLPKLMRSAGRLVAKARSLAGEFTAAFDQMAREAEMEDLRKEIEDLKKNNPITDVKREMEDSLAPIDKELREEAQAIHKAANETPKPETAPAETEAAQPEAEPGETAQSPTAQSEAAHSEAAKS